MERMSKIILMLQSLVGSCPMFSTASDFSEIIGFNLMEGFIFEVFAFSEQLRRLQKCHWKNIKTVYIACWWTPLQTKPNVLHLMQHLLSHLIHFSLSEFHKDVVKSWDSEIFLRKPDRHLIIYVLEDTCTIPIWFPWLLTHVIIMYIFYHSLIMTCQRKHVTIQAGKHLIKTAVHNFRLFKLFQAFSFHLTQRKWQQ